MIIVCLLRIIYYEVTRKEQGMRGRQSVNLPSPLPPPPLGLSWPAQCSVLSAQPLGRAVTLIVSTYGALGHRNASLLYLLQAIMLAQGNVRNVEFD